MRRMPAPPRTVGLIGRAVAKFMVDEGSVYSGHVAFSTLLALFPFLIFVTALAAFVGAAQKADHYVALLATVLPEEVARSIGPTVKQILSTRRGSVLTVSLIDDMAQLDAETGLVVATGGVGVGAAMVLERAG